MNPTAVRKIDESRTAKRIEEQTAKIPSELFLWGALGAIGASAVLQAMKRRETSNFVGQWAPVLLILGLYNKLVKVAGSEGEGIAGSSQQ